MTKTMQIAKRMRPPEGVIPRKDAGFPVKVRECSAVYDLGSGKKIVKAAPVGAENEQDVQQ
jgi:hypothetical protein